MGAVEEWVHACPATSATSDHSDPRVVHVSRLGLMLYELPEALSVHALLSRCEPRLSIDNRLAIRNPIQGKMRHT